MISFNKEQNVFYLNTDNTSYVIGLFKGELPVHIYWGKRVNSVPDNWADLYESKVLSAHDYGEASSNNLPLEYPTFGGADMRRPAFTADAGERGRHIRLAFRSFEIIDGKPGIKGLPATYAESGDEAQTLNLTLFDEVMNIEVVLIYGIFPKYDVITRSERVINRGGEIDITGVMSASVDFYALGDYDMITLDGAWARERYISRRSVGYGNQSVESRCGVSSAYHNPFMALVSADAGEESGEAYGFALVYSGDFVAGAEKDTCNTARAYIGINPFEFSWRLKCGGEFAAPEAVLVYSDAGIGKMSRIYHKIIRERLCRGKYRSSERFVLINNWEATYFDFNEEKIAEIAEKAKSVGVDTMVLDDGWFGRRTSDRAGLGDWTENRDRLPNGIDGLADRINALGMHFGLWFEPEMVNPDSDLFRAHPDWIIHTENRTPSMTRNQYTLDLSRDEVCDYVINAVSNVQNKANVEYVKWDMNRYMSEVGSAALPGDRQGETKHRYMLGLYRVMETVTGHFPDVLFEGCASGGSRFDMGILHYMPQIWTSDDSDAAERLKIQYGTSIVYPYSAMGAHVSAVPNHQIGRITPFGMRCETALAGQFGFELDLNKCSEDELETAREYIEKYNELADIFHFGDLYRIKSPFDGKLAVSEFVSGDRRTAVLCIASAAAVCNSGEETIRLRGLCPGERYAAGGTVYDSDYLMNCGIVYRNDFENKSEIIVLKMM